MSTATAAEIQSSTGTEVPPGTDAPASAEPIYFSPVLEGFDWQSEFELGNAVMDETHHEFVATLDALIRASDADFLARLDEFARHTADHFEREQHDMETMKFPSMHCHQSQHDNVLEAVRDVRERVAGGDVLIGRYLAERIAEWFPEHADSMDRALVRWIEFMQQGGAESCAGEVPDIGCGSACSSGRSHSGAGGCGSGKQSGCGGSGCHCG